MSVGLRMMSKMLLVFSVLSCVISPTSWAKDSGANGFVSDVNAVNSLMTQAEKSFGAGDKDKALILVSQAEKKLITALRSKYSTDSRYVGYLANVKGYWKTTSIHPENSGVDYVKRFESKISCWVGGCQATPLSHVMQIRFTDGTVSVFRSHGSPFDDNDDDFIGSLDLRVLSHFGFFQMTNKEVVMLPVVGNWRGGGWNLTIMNLSRNLKAEKYTSLFKKQDLPSELIKHWDDRYQSFLNVCDTYDCPDAELKQFDEKAGKVVFNSITVKLRQVKINQYPHSNRQKLLDLFNRISTEGASPRYSKIGLNDINNEVTSISIQPKAVGLDQITLSQIGQLAGVRVEGKANRLTITFTIAHRNGNMNLTFMGTNTGKPIRAITITPADTFPSDNLSLVFPGQ
ncbi:hypothetical protein [Cohnella mopanensis]|uniref:hypothetical protein n=1 Tax=Cohnella mopanensis TaxID=2911966 RepID=UPI001EF7AF83|nr:hypothetical protein [Cohnella mopanensis]